MFQFTKDDIMYFIQLGVMMLLSLVVLVMVIRPLLKRVLAADPKPPVEELPPALPEAPPPPPQITNATGQMIDVAQVQGQVHAQAVHRVGELAERNPSETASIIRQWLAEPA
jgi:flagellar M-ring protein FliF